ncbi:MAG TPA: hypothetical protein VEY10_04570 [Flavisolibacter sp.]|nr:hypothetical protein [Flavisolibacter sp.]
MRYLLTGILSLFLIAFFNSCKKEVSLELGSSAKGALRDNGGDCLPKTVTGTYMAGRAFTDSNFIEVTVDVLTAGPYTIATDTLNGYSFKATGTFSAIGANTVRLKGSGTPVANGVNNFTVVFDSSFCEIAITVVPAGSTGGPATFTLAGSPNGCTAFDLQGTYIKDTSLTGTNRVGVQVNVSTTGTYSIATNTVNGYSFTNTGTFSTTGIQTVFLQGTGKPVAAKTDNFTVTAGTLTCTFPVVVLANTPSPCGITPQGTYTSGTALSATNRVVLTHNYTAAGPYTVSTGTVNGYSFSTSPTPYTATAGANTITLNATGTPTTTGTNTFTVNFGDGTSCTFAVTVVAGTTPVPNNDHFPLTANSWWSYDDFFSPGDTIKMTNAAAATIGGNIYRAFHYSDDSGPFDTSHFRKSANDYFEYRPADFYSAVLFDAPQKVDILFLKENLTTNATWNSAVFPGTSNGQALNLRYAFTCADANASLTVNGKSFTNVYKITFKGQVSTMGSPYTDDGAFWTAFYARGVGLISLQVTDGTTVLYEQKIRNWVVF